MRITQHTLVLIADGQRATFLRNSTKGEPISLEILHNMAFLMRPIATSTQIDQDTPKLA